MRSKIIKNKKIILISLSFLIPLITYLTVFYINGLLTEKTILSGDMYAQYYPLFNYLKGVFEGTNSIFYSFSKGLGGTMFGTIFYYLSSPLNLFLIFIDRQYIPDFMTYLVIIKLSLCGLTMYLYMRRKYKTDNLLLLTFSLCYAFMGYNLNYFINIMWLDVVFMTPLVLIGVDKIIEDKNSTFYIVTLFISIFSNYYIAYMLCIFCVLYFVYEILLRYNIKEDKQIIKRLTKKFIISSLFTGGLCSFFLVPCFFEMLTYGRVVDLKEIFKFDYNFFNLFSKNYISSIKINDGYSIGINLYCSILIPLLIYVYFCNSKITNKEKKLTLTVIIIILSSCFIMPINYFFHLFTLPNGFENRHSFLLCLFFIRIAYYSYEKKEIYRINIILYIILFFIITVYFILFNTINQTYENIDNVAILLTIFFLLLYTGSLIKIKEKKYLDKFIISVIILEQLISLNIVFFKSTFFYKKELETNYSDIISKITYADRIEINTDNIPNLSIKNQYRGVNVFLSTINKNEIYFLKQVGKKELYNDKKIHNEYNIKNQSHILEAIIGLDKKVDKIEEKNNYIITNKNSLGFGYIIKNKCNNISFSFYYDQEIYNCIMDTNNSFYKKIDLIKKDKNEYSFNLEKKGLYYIYLHDIRDKNSNDIFNENFINSIIYKSKNYYMIKNDIENNVLKINTKNIDDKKKLEVIFFDYEEFNNIEVNIDKLDYKIEKNVLNGEIKTKGGILLLTLPYEKGFKIYVDNRLTPYEKVLDSLIGVKLEEGKHKIDLEYEQPKLKEGIVISIIAYLLYFINKKT